MFVNVATIASSLKIQEVFFHSGTDTNLPDLRWHFRVRWHFSEGGWSGVERWKAIKAGSDEWKRGGRAQFEDQK